MYVVNESAVLFNGLKILLCLGVPKSYYDYTQLIFCLLLWPTAG